MPFRLRYKAHDLELVVGDFVIGRSAECQLAVDDPLVSRRHAALHVTPDKVVAEDLGSRNGIVVNGRKVQHQAELADGDHIRIGSQEMTLHRVDEHGRRNPDIQLRITHTLGHAELSAMRDALEGVENEPTTTETAATRQAASLRLLCGVADKAFALGRGQEAERILSQALTELLATAQRGQDVDENALGLAARYAVKLASVTGKGSWADYAFDLYKAEGKILPAQVVDDLYTIVRKVKALTPSKIRGYLVAIRDSTARRAPAERFLLQRIEGLERLIALK
jgi:pSer/pThr/pTyr-binding forkhead associated (FHA) protein